MRVGSLVGKSSLGATPPVGSPVEAEGPQGKGRAIPLKQVCALSFLVLVAAL